MFANRMKGIQMTSSWILLIVAGLAFSFDTVAAYTMNETCLYYNGDFIASYDSCREYGYCHNGTLVGMGTCPPDTYYNADEGVCQYNAKCRLSYTNPCQGSYETKYVADQFNCSIYYYCSNGVSTTYVCPKYQVYDPLNNQCSWENTVSRSCNGPSMCLLVPNYSFVGNPNNCGEALYCADGNAIPSSCRNGYYFNPRTGQCQAQKYCPNDGDKNEGGNTNSNPPNDPTKCIGQPDGEGSFVPDGATCYGFYICDGNGKGGMWSKCPPNTHFNGYECTSPFTFNCTYDRCGNTNGKFMGAIGNYCHNYLNCQNGRSLYPPDQNGNYVGTPCGQNYYFDEYSQLCVDTSPAVTRKDYRLCTAVPAPPGGN